MGDCCALTGLEGALARAALAAEARARRQSTTQQVEWEEVEAVRSQFRGQAAHSTLQRVPQANHSHSCMACTENAHLVFVTNSSFEDLDDLPEVTVQRSRDL